MREPAPRGDDELTRLASWMTRPVPASIIIKPCGYTQGHTVMVSLYQRRCSNALGLP